MENGNLKIAIQMKGKNNLLANANVSFETYYGRITIKGFQIWKSSKFNERLSDSINITPPSRQAYGKYFALVFFEDKNQWYEMEQAIYNHYHQAILEQSKEDEIDIDAIPI